MPAHHHECCPHCRGAGGLSFIRELSLPIEAPFVKLLWLLDFFSQRRTLIKNFGLDDWIEGCASPHPWFWAVGNCNGSLHNSLQLLHSHTSLFINICLSTAQRMITGLQRQRWKTLEAVGRWFFWGLRFKYSLIWDYLPPNNPMHGIWYVLVCCPILVCLML